MTIQNTPHLIPLTLKEQREIDGGFVCAGLCVAALVTIGAVAGSAFVIGAYNGYQNAG